MYYINLLTTKSAVIVDSETKPIYSYKIDNPTGTKIIAGENNATQFQVTYPNEYAGYKKYVTMKNERGQGNRVYFETNDNIQLFTLGSDMTYAGYTRLYFGAELSESTALWDNVPIKIWSTDPMYGQQADDNPDILNLALANSIEAIEIAEEAEDKAQSVVDRANAGEFNFVVSKVYNSYSALIAETGIGLNIGDFGIIASTVDDPHNSELYVWNGTQYNFVTDMSGAQGFAGWSPNYGIVYDGTRTVQKLINWVGGEGAVPTIFIGEYVGQYGFTNDISLATDIRGLKGEKGNNAYLFWQDDNTEPVPYIFTWEDR